MDKNNETKQNFSFPNSDRPLDSKEEIKGPVNKNPEHEAMNFKDVMEDKESQFIQNDSGVPKITTYNSDVAQAIKNNNVSAMQIALSEQRKQQDRQDNMVGGASTQSKSLFLKTIAILLFLVLVVLGYLWWIGYLTPKNIPIKDSQSNAPTSTNQPSSAIKIEQRQIIQIDGKDSISIKSDINKAKNGIIDNSTIKELVLGTQSDNGSVNSITTADWFNKLDTHASDQLIRALDNNYTMGVYGSTPRETFIIFNVKSYDNAFSAMLNWEPYLNEDLGGIFDRGLTQNTKIGTTTNNTNPRIFEDKVLFNKDTKILSNNGQTTMLYSFIDPKTLVIVSSETGLREIISRLTTGKITR